MLKTLLARAKEPSSYAGLGLVAGALGLHLSSVQLDAVSSAGVAVAGLIAVFLPEKGGN